MPKILQVENLSLLEFKDQLRQLLKEEFAALNNSIPSNNSPPFYNNLEKLLSQKEAAAFLRISIPTFRNMVRERKIKPIKVGKRYRYKKSQLIN